MTGHPWNIIYMKVNSLCWDYSISIPIIMMLLKKAYFSFISSTFSRTDQFILLRNLPRACLELGLISLTVTAFFALYDFLRFLGVIETVL